MNLMFNVVYAKYNDLLYLLPRKITINIDLFFLRIKADRVNILREITRELVCRSIPSCMNRIYPIDRFFANIQNVNMI